MIKTQILQVKDFLDLKNPTGKLRKGILDFLKLDYTVYLDFENVEDLNYDFSKESLNILRELYSKDFLKERIKLVNANKQVQASIEKLNDLTTI